MANPTISLRFPFPAVTATLALVLVPVKVLDEPEVRRAMAASCQLGAV
jgi:hypothetical protein